MRLIETTKEDLTTKEGVINFAKEPWPDGIWDVKIPDRAPAHRHALEVLNAIGLMKVKIMQILDGYNAYMERKNDGTQYPVDRIYKG
jgi:hypothetical protein